MKFRRFFPLVWRNRKTVVLGLDLWAGLIGAAIIAFVVPEGTFSQVSGTLNMAELGVAAALVGVVLAGLAILFAFMTPEFTRLATLALEDLDRLYFPFWFVSGLAVATATLNVIGLASDETVWIFPRRVLLFASSWFFLWALFGTFFLVPYVAALGAIRGAVDNQQGSDR